MNGYRAFYLAKSEPYLIKVEFLEAFLMKNKTCFSNLSSFPEIYNNKNVRPYIGTERPIDGGYFHEHEIAELWQVSAFPEFEVFSLKPDLIGLDSYYCCKRKVFAHMDLIFREREKFIKDSGKVKIGAYLNTLAQDIEKLYLTNSKFYMNSALELIEGIKKELYGDKK